MQLILVIYATATEYFSLLHQEQEEYLVVEIPHLRHSNTHKNLSLLHQQEMQQILVMSVMIHVKWSPCC